MKYHPKLVKLAEIEGYDPVDVDLFIEACALDSICPAICMEPHCNYSAELEPDQDEGWCECCDKNSMKSALIIGGFI